MPVKSRKGINKGEKNGNWKGNKAVPVSGRYRAEKSIELTNCVECGEMAEDRHHKDGNLLNNIPENISCLCRRCHMLIDGRLEKLLSCEKNRTRGQSGRFISHASQRS